MATNDPFSGNLIPSIDKQSISLAFTSVSDTDNLIFELVDNDSIYNLYLSCKSVQNVCDDFFWYKRFANIDLVPHNIKNLAYAFNILSKGYQYKFTYLKFKYSLINSYTHVFKWIYDKSRHMFTYNKTLELILKYKQYDSLVYFIQEENPFIPCSEFLHDPIAAEVYLKNKKLGFGDENENWGKYIVKNNYKQLIPIMLLAFRDGIYEIMEESITQNNTEMITYIMNCHTEQLQGLEIINKWKLVRVSIQQGNIVTSKLLDIFESERPNNVSWAIDAALACGNKQIAKRLLEIANKFNVTLSLNLYSSVKSGMLEFVREACRPDFAKNFTPRDLDECLKIARMNGCMDIVNYLREIRENTFCVKNGKKPVSFEHFKY